MGRSETAVGNVAASPRASIAPVPVEDVGLRREGAGSLVGEAEGMYWVGDGLHIVVEEVEAEVEAVVVEVGFGQDGSVRRH